MTYFNIYTSALGSSLLEPSILLLSSRANNFCCRASFGRQLRFYYRAFSVHTFSKAASKIAHGISTDLSMRPELGGSVSGSPETTRTLHQLSPVSSLRLWHSRFLGGNIRNHTTIALQPSVTQSRIAHDLWIIRVRKLCGNILALQFSRLVKMTLLDLSSFEVTPDLTSQYIHNHFTSRLN